MPKITGLPQDSSPSTDDFTITVDTTSGQAKKVTLADLATLVYNSLPAGVVVQAVSTLSTAVATGTTAMFLDDTIPQNTEGTEFFTVSITPKSATNLLIIHVQLFLSQSGLSNTIGALFQDSNANAIAVGQNYNGTATAPAPVFINHTMTAGTTNPITFRVRGGSTAGTTTLNGQSGARQYGAITKSSIVVTEVKV